MTTTTFTGAEIEPELEHLARCAEGEPVDPLSEPDRWSTADETLYRAAPSLVALARRLLAERADLRATVDRLRAVDVAGLQVAAETVEDAIWCCEGDEQERREFDSAREAIAAVRDLLTLAPSVEALRRNYPGTFARDGNLYYGPAPYPDHAAAESRGPGVWHLRAPWGPPDSPVEFLGDAEAAALEALRLWPFVP